MADLFENPIGLDGFEFLEFTAPKKGMLEPIFDRCWNQRGLHFGTAPEPCCQCLGILSGVHTAS